MAAQLRPWPVRRLGGRVLPRIPAVTRPRREGAQNIPRHIRRDKRSCVLRRGDRGVLWPSHCPPEARPRSLPCPQRLLPTRYSRASGPTCIVKEWTCLMRYDSLLRHYRFLLFQHFPHYYDSALRLPPAVPQSLPSVLSPLQARSSFLRIFPVEIGNNKVIVGLGKVSHLPPKTIFWINNC